MGDSDRQDSTTLIIAHQLSERNLGKRLDISKLMFCNLTVSIYSGLL